MEEEQIKSYIAQMEALVKNISFSYKMEKKVYNEELVMIKSLCNALQPIGITE